MPFIRNTSSIWPLSARWGKLGLAPRRTVHSWKPAEEVGQPQDGAGMAVESAEDRPMQNSTAPGSALREPEDARLTGGTRSLMRRVLGLNVMKKVINPTREAFVRKLPLPQAPAA